MKLLGSVEKAAMAALPPSAPTGRGPRTSQMVLPGLVSDGRARMRL
ncbi:MAG TPA: hypothetical protein VEG38_07765 [Acidimicrobiia bacterium]|nr:hypothetical protein [Acidimicrobiia bacterium]